MLVGVTRDDLNNPSARIAKAIEQSCKFPIQLKAGPKGSMYHFIGEGNGSDASMRVWIGSKVDTSTDTVLECRIVVKLLDEGLHPMPVSAFNGFTDVTAIEDFRKKFRALNDTVYPFRYYLSVLAMQGDPYILHIDKPVRMSADRADSYSNHYYDEYVLSEASGFLKSVSDEIQTFGFECALTGNKGMSTDYTQEFLDIVYKEASAHISEVRGSLLSQVSKKKGLPELDYAEDYWGQPLADYFEEVLDKMGLWDEPSIQGGLGSIAIFDTDNNLKYSGDFESMGEDLEQLYYSSKTPAGFKKAVRNYVSNCIANFSTDDEDLATL